MDNLARFQSINPPSKPLIGLSKVEQEDYLVKLSKTIRSLVEEFAKKPPPLPTLTLPITHKRRSNVVAAVALAALVLIAVIAVLLWRNLSDRSLPSTEVAAARLQSQPASGASPANPRRYDVEAGFPTGPPPPGTVYATIGFTVWRTRPATTRDGADAARETIDS
jgi:hypothetical protein